MHVNTLKEKNIKERNNLVEMLQILIVAVLLQNGESLVLQWYFTQSIPAKILFMCFTAKYFRNFFLALPLFA